MKQLNVQRIRSHRVFFNSAKQASTPQLNLQTQFASKSALETICWENLLAKCAGRIESFEQTCNNPVTFIFPGLLILSALMTSQSIRVYHEVSWCYMKWNNWGWWNYDTYNKNYSILFSDQPIVFTQLNYRLCGSQNFFNIKFYHGGEYVYYNTMSCWLQ